MKAIISNIPVKLDAMLPGNEGMLLSQISKGCGVKASQISDFEIAKKSVDARRASNVHFVISAIVDISDIDKAGLSAIKPAKGVAVKPYEPTPPLDVADLSFVAKERVARPVVVGAGPAGLFCALYLARAGLAPIIVERGKSAEERMKDIEAFSSGRALNLDSNVQFGEGGAGTFSDGKLTTGIKSPHIRHVLEELVDAGAQEDILVEAKPHIGTDVLVNVVSGLRRKIEEAGGEFLFSTKAESVIFDGEGKDRRVVGVALEKVGDATENVGGSLKNVGNEASQVSASPLFIETDTVVLAIGHSARDTFAALKDAGIEMQRKPFAAGVRIEHLRRDIDIAQYGKFARHKALGAADYKLACKTGDGRGVYTFCMCPGGHIVAASSEEGGLCINGMSRRARDAENSNSALLVEVRPDDLGGADPLAGVELQRAIERAAFDLGDGSYKAPVQTVEDFLNGAFGEPSIKVNPSYPRGVAWKDLHDCLPGFISSSLEEGLGVFAKRLKAFGDGQAVLTGVEARSSSPVRIVRDPKELCSVSSEGLYPCGEGAGYAGGIMSAAVDGIRVAEAICAKL